MALSEPKRDAQEQVIDLMRDLSDNAQYHWPNDLGFDTFREEREPIDLSVQGNIPAYAAGVLFRNGPAGHRVKDASGVVVHERQHWFDGFSQLHRFEMTVIDGSMKVRYNSRINVDSLLESLRQTGSYNGYTFGQRRDPCMSLFRKIMCLFTPSPAAKADYTNCQICVSAQVSHLDCAPETLIARTDESRFKFVDARTLEPVGIADQASLHPLLKGPLSATHAKSDPVTGDVFNYNLDLGYQTVYRIFKTSASTGETSILAEITEPDLEPAYIHSLFLSEDFVILCVWGSHLSYRGLKVLWEKNMIDAMTFDPSKPTKWYVVDRRHTQGVVAKFESPGMYAFHTINAWQAKTDSADTVDLICDLIEYEDMSIMQKFYYNNIKSSANSAHEYTRLHHKEYQPHFARYRLSGIPRVRSDSSQATGVLELKAGVAEKTTVMHSPLVGDVPTINNAFVMRKNRYFYCLVDRGRSTFFDSLAKVDVESRTSVYWAGPSGHTPGEAVFIADPAGQEEDDGILLTIVLDAYNDTSYLLCLDAKNMTELGRADCAGPIPFTFHGQHLQAVDGRFKPSVDF